jgi:NAD(P)-dependent dehydrogenase (short-subunit alcohol dehydrogenase family)
MNIVIVGASRGIGRALADRFRARGDFVITASRSEPTDWHLDIRRSDEGREILRMFRRVDTARDRPIDAVICCAGAYDASDSDVVLTNVLGAWNVAKQACLHMQLGGSVVLFSGGGVGGEAVGKDCPTLYAATKAAVVQMVEGLARSYPKVRINAVAPGPIDTGLTGHGGETPDKTVSFVEWLLEQKHISGRLLSVKWDTPEMWATPSYELGKLRRIT